MADPGILVFLSILWSPCCIRLTSWPLAVFGDVTEPFATQAPWRQLASSATVALRQVVKASSLEASRTAEKQLGRLAVCWRLRLAWSRQNVLPAIGVRQRDAPVAADARPQTLRRVRQPDLRKGGSLSSRRRRGSREQAGYVVVHGCVDAGVRSFRPCLRLDL